MMLSNAILLFLSLHGAAQDEQLKPRPIYNDVIARTTGQNGYEEYVRAGDMIRLGPAERPYSIVYSYVEPGKPEPPYLQSRRDLVAHGSKVLDVVRAGNKKPVFEPREKMGVWTLFPELADFKRIVRLFAAESYVRYASGNPMGGIGSILDGLTFSYKSSQLTLISNLVSIATSAILFAEVSARIPHMSEAEANKVIAFVDEQLAQPDPILRAFEGERQYISSSIDSLIDAPNDPMAGSEVEDEELNKIIAELKALSPAARASLKVRVSRRLDGQYQKVLARLSRPPSAWEPAKEPEVEEEPVTLEDKVAGYLDPFVFQQALTPSGRRQAQLALFRLHAVIMRFKWQHNRLPKDLKELEQPEYTKDPLSDEDFVYEQKGGMAYDVYSKGYKSTGPVQLKYQRPPGLGKGDDYEPPAPGFRVQGSGFRVQGLGSRV